MQSIGELALVIVGGLNPGRNTGSEGLNARGTSLVVRQREGTSSKAPASPPAILRHRRGKE